MTDEAPDRESPLIEKLYAHERDNNYARIVEKVDLILSGTPVPAEDPERHLVSLANYSKPGEPPLPIPLADHAAEIHQKIEAGVYTPGVGLTYASSALTEFATRLLLANRRNGTTDDSYPRAISDLATALEFSHPQPEE